MSMVEDPYNTKLNLVKTMKADPESKTKKPHKDDVRDLPGDDEDEPYPAPIKPETIFPTFEMPGEGGLDPPKKPVKP